MKRIWIAIGLAVVLVVIGAASVTARQQHPISFRGTVHVVQPGESLWKIVRAAYPSGDPRSGIDAVRQANHLRSSSVSAGQRLLLPSR